MSFLRNIFGGKAKSASTRDAPASALCTHIRLAPKWDSAADMGHADKVTRYQCESCNESFSPEVGRAMQAALLKGLET